MSRRRYLSTEISLDGALNRVAKRSDFAALLYSWMIPHASDDATITGDPEKLLMAVMPGRRDKEPADVEAALRLLSDEGMFELWSRATNTVYLWPESFYRYQTYIKPANRRTSPADAEERRKTPPNTASLSLSLSHSPSHSPSQDLKHREVVENRSPASKLSTPPCAQPVDNFVSARSLSTAILDAATP